MTKASFEGVDEGDLVAVLNFAGNAYRYYEEYGSLATDSVVTLWATPEDEGEATSGSVKDNDGVFTLKIDELRDSDVGMEGVEGGPRSRLVASTILRAMQRFSSRDGRIGYGALFPDGTAIFLDDRV